MTVKKLSCNLQNVFNMTSFFFRKKKLSVAVRLHLFKLWWNIASLSFTWIQAEAVSQRIHGVVAHI